MKYLLTLLLLTASAFGQKLADLTTITSAATGDFIPIVDVSDTTHSAQGSTRKITLANLIKDLGTPTALTLTNATGLPTTALTGSVTDAQVPNTITIDLATLATTATTANGVANNSVTGAGIALASQAAGDVMYYDGTDWVRLAKGTAGQVLEMNAGATAPEWGTDGGSGSLTATYVGFGDGSNALSGEAAFAYNATTNTLSVENATISGTGTVGVVAATTVTVGGTSVVTLLDAKQGLTHSVAADPDISVEGHLSYESDVDVIRAFDGTQQVAIARKIEAIQVNVVLPNDLADSERDAFWVWKNVSGMSFIVTGWAVTSDTDDTDLNIETVDGTGASNATVDAVTAATNGTGMFYGSDTTITAGTIANGSLIVLDFDDTDAPGQVHLTIYGYYAPN